MSMYITFKKGDDVLFGICRTERLYELLNNYIPFGDYSTVTHNDLQNALSNLIEERNATRKNIALYKEAVRHMKDFTI